jgi:hypothetical protein
MPEARICIIPWLQSATRPGRMRMSMAPVGNMTNMATAPRMPWTALARAARSKSKSAYLAAPESELDPNPELEPDPEPVPDSELDPDPEFPLYGLPFPLYPPNWGWASAAVKRPVDSDG